MPKNAVVCLILLSTLYSKKLKLYMFSRKIFLNIQIEQWHLNENFPLETLPIPFYAKSYTWFFFFSYFYFLTYWLIWIPKNYASESFNHQKLPRALADRRSPGHYHHHIIIIILEVIITIIFEINITIKTHYLLRTSSRPGIVMGDL